MKYLAALLLLLCATSVAATDPSAFTFGGETFVQKFEVKGRAPNAQIEFGLAHETLEGWTKLVTLHSFTQNGNDASRAVTVLANLIRDRHKGAKYRVIKNATTREAIIDFLVPVPNSELMEFNLFKYAPAGDELVAFQFAQRVKLGEIDAEELRNIRNRAVEELVSYDMAPVRAFFGKAN
jgi:hypothetical protein